MVFAKRKRLQRAVLLPFPSCFAKEREAAAWCGAGTGSGCERAARPVEYPGICCGIRCGIRCLQHHSAMRLVTCLLSRSGSQHVTMLGAFFPFLTLIPAVSPPGVAFPVSSPLEHGSCVLPPRCCFAAQTWIEAALLPAPGDAAASR